MSADVPVPQTVRRAPGTPATAENTPAPAFDPALEPGSGPGDPTDEEGHSIPAQSATGLPSGPVPE